MVKVIQSARMDWIGERSQVRSDAYQFSTNADAQLGMLKIAGVVPNDFVTQHLGEYNARRLEWLTPGAPLDYPSDIGFTHIQDYVIIPMPYEFNQGDFSTIHTAYQLVFLHDKWVYVWWMTKTPLPSLRFKFLHNVGSFDDRIPYMRPGHIADRLLTLYEINLLGWGSAYMVAHRYEQNNVKQL